MLSPARPSLLRPVNVRATAGTLLGIRMRDQAVGPEETNKYLLLGDAMNGYKRAKRLMLDAEEKL